MAIISQNTMVSGAAEVKIAIRAESQTARLVQPSAAGCDEEINELTIGSIKSKYAVGSPTGNVKMIIRSEDECASVRQSSSAERNERSHRGAGTPVVAHDAKIAV